MKSQTNRLYMPKRIHSIYFIIEKTLWYKKTDEFTTEKLLAPITKQYLEIYASNSTYARCTSAASLIDTMKF